MITVYCDALCEPNPGGWICWAFLALDPAGHLLHSASRALRPAPGNTNNYAELGAVLRALEWAHMTGHTESRVYSDSQLAVRYATEGGAHPNLAPVAAKIRALTPRGTRFQWIPRSENGAADALTRATYRRATGQEPTDWSARKRHTPSGDHAA